MKNKIITFGLLIVCIIILMLIRTNFSDHTLKKTISACVLAQKQTSKSFNREQAKKYCEKEIKKSIKSSK